MELSRWIDSSYYLITLVHVLLSFESRSHSTIVSTVVCGDFITYTCIISDVVLDHKKKVTVTGIGARKYILQYILPKAHIPLVYHDVD